MPMLLGILLTATAACQPVAPPAPAAGRVGGPCETCELMYLGQPARPAHTCYTPGWHSSSQRLLVRGRILQPDGRTPAAGILLYFWHTDSTGRYRFLPGGPAGTEAHGYLRGWVQTDAQGRFEVYTSMPAAYADGSSPAHIHVLIKEPEMPNEYYTDDWVFDNDPLVNTAYRRQAANRGGSGILRPVLHKGVWQAEQQIVLGLHVPGHPAGRTRPRSGLAVGEDCPSFMPQHAWGPDQGSRACPVCKYGRYDGLLLFAHGSMPAATLAAWAQWLEALSATRQPYLKAYIITTPRKGESAADCLARLAAMGQRLQLRHMAVTMVPAFTDRTSEVNLQQINPSVNSTLIWYRHRRIQANFVNMEPDSASLDTLTQLMAMPPAIPFTAGSSASH